MPELSFCGIPLETLATRLAHDLKTKVVPYHDLDGKYEWEEHRHKLVLTGDFSKKQVKDSFTIQRMIKLDLF